MKRKTKDLIIYYFSHRTGTTQWVDPRMAQVKKATVDDCDEDGTLSVFLGNLIFFFFGRWVYHVPESTIVFPLSFL